MSGRMDTPFMELQVAVIADDAARVRAAIDAGADPEQYGASPGAMFYLRAVTQAAVRGKAKAMAALLESRRVRVNKGEAENGMTPLHFAADSGHHEVIVLLIQAGADPRQPADDGRTALMIAEAKHSEFGGPDRRRCLAILQAAGGYPAGTGTAPQGV